ncbi:hypothetical protein HK100_002911 [Physocladia obscura]|uniref:Uncharacterized protein n=1 Tax=Physocladia obscura TaxID=109957 RepID=A0AAD5SUY7_9FUNG|nr:hypothetical protein HK100_002911 [Physocladia obscura]
METRCIKSDFISWLKEQREKQDSELQRIADLLPLTNMKRLLMASTRRTVVPTDNYKSIKAFLSLHGPDSMRNYSGLPASQVLSLTDFGEMANALSLQYNPLY